MLGFLTRSSSKPTQATAKLTRSPPLKGKNVEVTVAPVSIEKPVNSVVKNSSTVDVTKPGPEKTVTIVSTASPVSETPPKPVLSTPPRTEQNKRRLSLKVPFLNGGAHPEGRKPTLSAVEEQEKKRQVRDDLEVYGRKLSRSEKHAHESATVVRSLIIGPSGITPSNKAKPVPKARLEKVKSELIHPKSAKMVIAHLRQMPSSGQPTITVKPDGTKVTNANGAIHAVCLAYTDTEAHEQHFCKLKGEPQEAEPSQTIERTASVNSALANVASVTNASVNQLTEMVSRLEIVSLITPDMGIGQPADGDGLLSGSLPTAEAVLHGVQQLTPQLMAIGYATGKAILPDHSGMGTTMTATAT